MPSLRQTEAVERGTLLRVHSCEVELDVTGDGERFSSRSLIRFFATRPGADTFVDFKGESLQEATLNGKPVDLERWSDGRLPLSELAAENELVIGGEMGYSNDGEGLHRSIDPADHRVYLYAMSFLDAGPRWFGCFDQPDLKARYTMRVRTPRDWTVLGNARFTETRPGRWEMAQTEPLSTYFVTLVAGPYASAFDEHDGITLGVHARASLARELSHQADDILEVTKQCFDAYHELFRRRYPFGGYHQCFVPDFNAGAMENPGCVIFRDQYLFRGAATAAERAQRAGTIAHEMAHQWFGDLVTMRWWDDLWLNESFAEYLGHRVCSERTRHPLWLDFSMNRKDWGTIADQGPSTHPVAGNGAADAQSALAQFDGISYAKGAALLRQLAAYLGEECFFAGLNDYFERHSFGNASFADLTAAWEGAGATGLEQWCRAWLLTEGMDTLRVHADSGSVSVEVIRDPADCVRPHVLSLGCFDTGGALLGTQPVTLEADPLVVGCGGDFVVPDVEDVTWARIRPGSHPTRWPSVSRIVNSATRAVLWNSLRDSVRSAEVDPAVALGMVCEQIPDEDEVVIVRAMLAYAHAELAGPYARFDDRRPRARALAQTAAGIWRSAAPESDLHLVAFRVFLQCTDDVTLLRTWLEGRDLPRPMDPELTWAAVWRLASLTGDRSVISAAFQRDTSASGRVHMAKALASIPETEAKEQAFDLLMNPSAASSYELYATAEGFFMPEQADLTEPFVKRFFERINSTAAFRHGWALSRLVMTAFPAAATTRSSLELAQRTLDGNALDPSVRRALTDATDRLRRAVTSVERYARCTETTGPWAAPRRGHK